MTSNVCIMGMSIECKVLEQIKYQYIQRDTTNEQLSNDFHC